MRCSGRPRRGGQLLHSALAFALAAAELGGVKLKEPMISFLGNRFGLLVPLFIMLSLWGVVVVADTFISPSYFKRHEWMWAFVFFIAGTVCWLLGRTLKARQPPPVTDPKTGLEPVPGTAAYARYTMREIDQMGAFGHKRDTLLFLHLVYWGPILALIGLLILLVSWLR